MTSCCSTKRPAKEAHAFGRYYGQEGEILAALQTALYEAFSSKKPVTTESVLEALNSTIPLSATRAEEIQSLRSWSLHRAIRASAPDAVAE